MQTRIEIEGFAEMVKMLDQLPDKLQKQAILNIERKSTKPVIQAAKSKLLSYGSNYKKLASSIVNITAKSKNPIIYAGPSVKGRFKYIGYIARWVEYGTSGIIEKKGRSKSQPGNKNEFAWVGALKKGSRYRADQPDKPFMRPAIDEKKSAVKDLFINNMKTYLDQVVSKAVSKLKR